MISNILFSKPFENRPIGSFFVTNAKSKNEIDAAIKMIVDNNPTYGLFHYSNGVPYRLTLTRVISVADPCKRNIPITTANKDKPIAAILYLFFI